MTQAKKQSTTTNNNNNQRKQKLLPLSALFMQDEEKAQATEQEQKMTIQQLLTQPSDSIDWSSLLLDPALFRKKEEDSTCTECAPLCDKHASSVLLSLTEMPQDTLDSHQGQQTTAASLSSSSHPHHPIALSSFSTAFDPLQDNITRKHAHSHTQPSAHAHPHQHQSPLTHALSHAHGEGCGHAAVRHQVREFCVLAFASSDRLICIGSP